MARALVRSRSVWKGVGLADRDRRRRRRASSVRGWPRTTSRLNGIEGPNNGWLCVLLAGPAFLWTRIDGARLLGGRRRRARERARDRVDGGGELARRARRPGRRRLLRPAPRPRGMRGAGSGRRRPGDVASPRPEPRRRSRPARRGRGAGAVALLVLALLFVVVFRQVLGITQGPSWPPPADAVTAAGAEAVTEAFVAREGVRPHDAELDFARSTAATIEPWVEGANFFPRIFADVEAARVVRAHPDVRLARGGGRDPDGGPARAEAAEGVEVRVIVDASAHARTTRRGRCSRGSPRPARRSW